MPSASARAAPTPPRGALPVRPAPPRPAPGPWYTRGAWKPVLEINLGVFQALLVAYLALLLIESVRKGTVTDYLNLNLLLVPVLVTGIVAVLTQREEEHPDEVPLRRRDYVLAAGMAVGSWLILWYQLRNLGWIQFPVSMVGGLLVGLVALSVLLPETQETQNAVPQDVQRPDLPPVPGPAASVLVARGRPQADGRLRFECPNCAFQGVLPVERVGTAVRCPRCRSLVRVAPEPPGAQLQKNKRPP